MKLQKPVDFVIWPETIKLFKKWRICTAAGDLDYANNDNSGWLVPESTITFFDRVDIEPNCAIFGGPYRGMMGFLKPTTGFCNMGFFSYSFSPLPETLSVGRYCSISLELSFLDYPHPTHYISTSCFLMNRTKVKQMLSDNLPGGNVRISSWEEGDTPYPEIGHDVWIGFGVTLKMGIKIGTGAIIAAHSVVTKDVPPYALVAGNPAEIKKYRFKEHEREVLLASRWWEFYYTDFAGLPIEDPCAFANALGDKEAKKEIRRMALSKLTLPDMLLENPQPRIE